ncbi:unnamed protein product [Discula destructiva]
MATPKKILFLCSSDYGQANVILATSYAILASGAPVELHIGSEHPTRPEVEATVRLADKSLPASAPHAIHFHGIDGVSHFRAMTRPQTGIMEAFDLPLPSFANAAVLMRRFSYAILPWEANELVDMYAQNVALLQELKPDLTVIDPLYCPGMTAARHLDIKWTVLAPNTIKDFATLAAPRGAALWKYPVAGSALPYPIPWSQIPINIGLTLILINRMLVDDRDKQLARRLREHAGDDKLELVSAGALGVSKAPPPGLRVMLAFSEDLDYPLPVIPDHIIQCGPIVRYAPKLVDVDPALDAWLSRGPSVYVNLGTQLKMTPAQGLEFAFALRDFFDTTGPSSRYQVLWKVKQDGSKGKEISWEGEWAAVRETLQPEIDADRTRITAWVEADPCSILQSGHIVCSVHHGGANSHHEALAAGVPHVVLPGWLDCYDFGNRVELNGVGIRANKTAAPRWARGELGEALKEVLVGDRAATFKENARKLAERHPEHAGRTKAARTMLEMLDAE